MTSGRVRCHEAFLDWHWRVVAELSFKREFLLLYSPDLTLIGQVLALSRRLGNQDPYLPPIEGVIAAVKRALKKAAKVQ